MTTIKPPVGVDVADILDILDYTPGEFVSLGYDDASGQFHTAVMTPADAVAAAAKLPATSNCYFGVNPITGPARKNAGRGTADTVTRLSALFCDLDVKPGACPTLDVAQAIVAELGIILGTRPSALVESGGGLHAYWPVTDCDITQAGPLLKRWGRLVAAVADKLDVNVDNVYDLARMLRLPGSVNNKTGQPRPVTAFTDTGGPLECAEVAERLDEVGIFARPDDTAEIDQTEVSTPSEWQWAEQTCGYVAKMVDGFATDSPKKGKGRSPWLISCKVRLNCAKRLGCITEGDYRQAEGNLEKRFAEVLADHTIGTPRSTKKFEHRDTKRAAIKRASAKTDDQCRAELGGHTHPEPAVESSIEDTPPPFTFTDGGTFIFDQPDTIPAIWGTDTNVLWAEGESLMIAGPMGLGKTTLGGQLVRARLGLGDGHVLGLPVTDSGGILLYLAMDRPRQIARSLARQFHGEAERLAASARLRVWQGPPPVDIAQNPGLLLRLAQEAGADTVVIDSVKDAAVGLTNDEVGAGYNRARQHLIAAGIELLELHHTVKRGATGGAPTAAADVYGSAWIANGTCSIIMLSGDPGDPIVGFKHIRQPADEVGPWQVHHDQAAGLMTVSDSFDVPAFVADCGAEGATAATLAEALNPGREWTSSRERNSAREKARRQLDRLVTAGTLVCVEGTKGGGGGRTPTAYFLAGGNHAPITRSAKPQVEQSRTQAITEAITKQSCQSREDANAQVEQSRTQSRSGPAAPITQPTVPVGDGGARGGGSPGLKPGMNGIDPNCIHCLRPVAAGQRNPAGRPAHLSCRPAPDPDLATL